ncbi:hypothetical protein JI664_23565 [Rhodobacter sp. NTK016B]|uniref:hypothetical protein n=1 Tax=Rhodobacter sp. NTK016B TaxID=2759676 RepID=UPI001A8CFB93|nr:hypothetical protein [Rhodobacter sp. NTK016B]MBN8294965.1 hypothetical protein [Rhodobacter sp. NTK016B]
MPAVAVLTVTLDRAAGAAELRKDSWSTRVSITDLPRWHDLYRRLWARGSKTTNGPGPWARFYEADLRALDAALTELKGDI